MTCQLLVSILLDHSRFFLALHTKQETKARVLVVPHAEVGAVQIVQQIKVHSTRQWGLHIGKVQERALTRRDEWGIQRLKLQRAGSIAVRHAGSHRVQPAIPVAPYL
jgi:hypothetical protein